jgi:HEAT repeat protein
MKRNASIAVGVFVAAAVIAGVVALLHSAANRAKATDALMEQIAGPDPSQRAAARERIAATYDGPMVTRLVGLLDGTPEYIQRDITATLADIGQPVVKPLVDALHTRGPDWETLSQGIISLGPGDPYRPAVARALVAIGPPAAPEVERLLKYPEPFVRCAAAGILGDIAPQSSVPALRRALDDSEASVRAAATKALGQIGGNDALDAILTAVADPDPGVRMAVVESLRRFAGARATDALEGLCADGDPHARASACIGYAGAAREKSVPTLVARLADSVPDVRAAATRALGDAGGSAAVEALIRTASSPDPILRAAAMYGLKKTGDPGAVRACIAALSDADRDVRLAAARALDSPMGRNESVAGPLIERSRVESDADVLCALIWALDYRDDAESVGAILDLAKNADIKIRVAAVDALGDDGDPRSKRALIAALADREHEVKKMAVACLRNFPNPDAIDALEEVAHYYNANVQGDGLDVAEGAVVDIAYTMDPRAADRLATIREHSYYGNVRLKAGLMLGALKDARVAESLIGTLKDMCVNGEPDAADPAYALCEIGGDKAARAVDEAVRRFDMRDVAANYARYIRRGDCRYLMPLAVTLSRNGDMKMAEDFYWSYNYSLGEKAQLWALSRGRLKELLASKDSPERPKWMNRKD